MLTYQVCTPVSNLTVRNSLETQLLFGERVLYTKQAFYACNQLVFDPPSWRPYPGSMDLKTLVCIQNFPNPTAIVYTFDATLEPWNLPLPCGTLLTITSKGLVQLPPQMLAYIHNTLGPGTPQCDPKYLRFFPLSTENMLNHAESFLEIPYVWGGRCIHSCLKGQGVDCSGFIHLLYQLHGLKIPRNARDQCRDCLLVNSFQELPNGGLVFLSDATNSRINHVMLKLNERLLIHAVETTGKVVYSRIGQDCEIEENYYTFSETRRRAFFGIPKKKKSPLLIGRPS